MLFQEQGIDVEMDALKGSLIVKTTKDTWDPYAIMLARDVIKLISRHVSLEKAVKVFEEGITSEIINVSLDIFQTVMLIYGMNGFDFFYSYFVIYPYICFCFE